MMRALPIFARRPSARLPAAARPSAIAWPRPVAWPRHLCGHVFARALQALVPCLPLVLCVATRAAAQSPPVESPARGGPCVFRDRQARPLLSGVAVARATPDDRTILLTTLDGAIPAPRDVVLLMTGVHPLARATLVAQIDRASGGRVDWMDASALRDRSAARLAGRTGVAIPCDAAARLRDDLQAHAAIWTRIASVGDSGRTVWLESGSESGFLPGDGLLAERDGWPVARLSIVLCEPTAALAAVTPLVANASSAAGDWARLWPTPREKSAGICRARVLRVAERGPDQDVWIPYDGPRAAGIDDRWIISRDGAYIGWAKVRAVTEQFVIATTNASFCREPARQGDVAERRAAADVLAGRTPLHVFRVEDNYCLLSAGEGDGIQRGMIFASAGPGAAGARLEVTTVHEDHCGAAVVADADSDTTAPGAAAAGARSTPGDTTRSARSNVKRFDEFRIHGTAPGVRPCARLTGIAAEAGAYIASYQPGQTPLCLGEPVSIRSRLADTAAIVVATDSVGATLVPLAPRLPPWIRLGDAVWCDDLRPGAPRPRLAGGAGEPTPVETGD